MKNDTLLNETNRATYEPESNKIRLYVGRVPREEYLALKAEGWTSTPKQSCDFAAVWTPERRDTAISYAGVIEDEDMTPEERAADRAERFSGYRDKRLDEACGHADRYESGPAVHGYQSERKAERAAARHDRTGTRAVDAWDKAEYWQRRTAGVIAHALYLSEPSVRMGRIKELEAAVRRFEASQIPEERLTERSLAWLNHFRLRLAYERQMIEAHGGLLGEVEIEVGGKVDGQVVWKVNKSHQTGRVVSVSLLGKAVSSWTYRATNIPGTTYAEYQFATERMEKDTYTPPTPEGLAEVAKVKAMIKAYNAKKPKAPPLINPTKEDAQRLQEELNKQQRFAGDKKEVMLMTQATYSANSTGSYGRCEVKELSAGPRLPGIKGYGRRPDFPAVCKIRMHIGGSVIVLTDKPQKALPEEIWNDPLPILQMEVAGQLEEVQALLSKHYTGDKDWTPEEKELVYNAQLAGFAYISSLTQRGLTDEGLAALKAQKEMVGAV